MIQNGSTRKPDIHENRQKKKRKIVVIVTITEAKCGPHTVR